MRFENDKFIFDNSSTMCKILQKQADKSNLGVAIFVASKKNGDPVSYVMIKDDYIIFDSSKAEDVGAHIDIMRLDKTVA